MSLVLHGRRFGEGAGPPLVILHGLLGASRNWMTIGKALGERFDVHALDLRNHGDSPHAESMEWAELVGDVLRSMDDAGPGPATLIGHSIGGKVAMRLACEHPERVERLIVADIAARDYPPYHQDLFDALRELEPTRLKNRQEADRALAPKVPDWATRQFLLTNLARDPASGGFAWKIHFTALDRALPRLATNPLDAGHRYGGPALLVGGAKSDFLRPEDPRELQRHFPMMETMMLPEAGHNVHIDDRDGFLNAVQNFVRRH